MSNSFRILTLSGFLIVTFLEFSPARAALLVNGEGNQAVCLNVLGSGTANGTPLEVAPCGEGFAEEWNFEELQIQGIGTSVDGSKCVDVLGGGTASGTPVQLFDCNGTGAQQWRYNDLRIINLRSGKCLGLNSQRQVKLLTCNFRNSFQFWKIR